LSNQDQNSICKCGEECGPGESICEDCFIESEDGCSCIKLRPVIEEAIAYIQAYHRKYGGLLEAGDGLTLIFKLKGILSLCDKADYYF
jgi:hypothetical protein